FARALDDAEELALLRGEVSRHGVRASDVAVVAAILGAGVDQHQLAGLQPPISGWKVQDRRVRAAGDDRVERDSVGTVAEELRLELDLERAFGAPRLDQLDEPREARCGRTLGTAHPLELEFVLRTADVIEVATQLVRQGFVVLR